MSGGDDATTASRGAGRADERRRVAVLFADMADFTAIAEKLGEEGAFNLMQPTFALMARAVREAGGVVHHFTGDGVMAIFGAPETSEDATLRACRAALAMQARLGALANDAQPRTGVRPAVRIGVNAGPVVVGQIEEGRLTYSGDTVNFCARLQELAEPGGILLSEAAWREVEGIVECEYRGERPVRGKAEPQKIFALTGVRAQSRRFDAALRRGLGAYVGRRVELERLESAKRSSAQRLRVVDIVGEPGIGKSRLVYEFLKGVDRESWSVLRGYCAPDGRQTPFRPFIDMIRGAMDIGLSDTSDEVSRKVAAALDAVGLNRREYVDLLLNLMGLPPAGGSLRGLDGALIGLRTRDLLRELLLARRRISPTILFIEDLHWIDSVSEELLSRFIVNHAGAPLLFILTRRPEYRPPWAASPAMETLALERLPDADTLEIARGRLANMADGEAMARLATEKAEGNALFAEEIAGYIAEHESRMQGATTPGGSTTLSLPPSLQALLAARVQDMPNDDRALLQAAAVIGRTFDPGLLSEIAEAPAEISGRLDNAAAQGFLTQNARSGVYTFKHALVRDALYESLLGSRREALHLEVAQAIERFSNNRLPEAAETLAYHYQRTNCLDKAFVYLSLAGKKSLGVYSLQEAGDHLRQAASLYERSPACASRRDFVGFLTCYILYLQLNYEPRQIVDAFDKYRSAIQELDEDGELVVALHHKVWANIMLTRHGEAERAQADVERMAASLGDDRSIAYAAAGEFFLHAIRGHVRDDIVARGDTAIEHALRSGDAYIVAWLRYTIIWDAVHRGHIGRARKLADDLAQTGSEMEDPRSAGLAPRLRSWIDIICGDHGQSLGHSGRGLEYAITPFDKATVETHLAIGLIMERRVAEGLPRLLECRAEAARHERLYELTGTDLSLGVAMIFQGRFGEGFARIYRAMREREREGYFPAVDWYRVALSQIILEMLVGGSRPPLGVIMRNFAFLVRLRLRGASRARAMLTIAERNAAFDETSFHRGNINYLLGLCDLRRGDHEAAARRFARAREIVAPHGAGVLLSRIDRSIAGLDSTPA